MEIKHTRARPIPSCWRPRLRPRLLQTGLEIEAKPGNLTSLDDIAECAV